MVQDYFEAKLALNLDTGNAMPGASAQVFAITDTSFSNPLPITDMTGVPMPRLTASATGIYVPFKVAGGITQVLARSGTVTTPITSVLGSVFAVIPDPSALADGRVIVTSGGSYSTVPSAFTPIPDPTLGDDNQVLAIKDGQWAIADPTGGGTIGGILDGGTP